MCLFGEPQSVDTFYNLQLWSFCLNRTQRTILSSFTKFYDYSKSSLPIYTNDTYSSHEVSQFISVLQSCSSKCFHLSSGKLCIMFPRPTLRSLNTRRLITCLIFITALSFWQYTLLVGKGHSSNPPQPDAPFLPTNFNQKIILSWTKFFDDDLMPFIADRYDIHSCPVNNCRFTNDRRYLKNSSAVIFHAHGRNLNAADLPPFRDPDQYYVFYLLEAPYLTKYDFRAAPWPDFFNLSWTYRRESDVLARHYLRFYLPTGLGENRKSRHARLAGKHNRALAMISNCRAPSNRDEYVRELQRHFPVDVAGDCGTITCPKSNADCGRMLRDYKFYLAFENGYVNKYVHLNMLLWPEDLNQKFTKETNENMPVSREGGPETNGK